MDIHTHNNNNIMVEYTKNNVSRSIVQDDALGIALKNKRCGLGISMGVGKTRIGIRHMIANIDPFINYLVVVPKHSVTE